MYIVMGALALVVLWVFGSACVSRYHRRHQTLPLAPEAQPSTGRRQVQDDTAHSYGVPLLA